MNRPAPLYKERPVKGQEVPMDRFSDGDRTGGFLPGNSAVEAMPTPEENIVLLPYF